MKYKLLLLVAVFLLACPLKAEKTYTVQNNDTLIKVLKREGLGADSKELYKYLEEVRRLNGDRFAGSSLDLIYPDEDIIIPTLYVESEPEPEPEPELELEPEPAAAEPALDYIGKAKLGRSQAELIRDNESNIIANEVDLVARDTLRTDTLGRAEIQLNDNSNYVVGPNSEFIIEDFRYQPSTSEKFVARLNLLFGSLSVKTGKIGKKSTDTYTLNTPAVSMGVRGTEYTVRYCEGDDCGAMKGATAAVKEGAIVVNTSDGVVEVPIGKFAQVEELGGEVIISEIPEGYFDLDIRPADIELSWFERIKRYARELID